MSKKSNEVNEMSCDECVICGNDVIYKKRYMETILQSIKQQTKVTSIFTTNYNGGMKTMKKRFENIVGKEKKRFSITCCSDDYMFSIVFYSGIQR